MLHLEIGTNNTLQAPSARWSCTPCKAPTLCPLSQLPDPVRDLNQVFLGLSSVTRQELALRDLPAAVQVINDVSIVEGGVGAGALSNGGEVL